MSKISSVPEEVIVVEGSAGGMNSEPDIASKFGANQELMGEQVAGVTQL